MSEGRAGVLDGLRAEGEVVATTAMPPLGKRRKSKTRAKTRTTSAKSPPPSSSSSSTPAASPPRPLTTTVASLAALAASIDVAEELAEDKDAYTGEEWFTITSLPSYLRPNLDRIRRRVDPRPGMGPTVACCLEHGLKSITSRDEIQGLLKLKETMDRTTWDSASFAHQIDEWYRSFLTGVDVGSGTKAGRQNIAIPKHTKIALSEAASDLGMAATQLAVLSITSTMSYQPDVIPTDADTMARTVAGFLRKVEVRRRMGEAMLTALRNTADW